MEWLECGVEAVYDNASELNPIGWYTIPPLQISPTNGEYNKAESQTPHQPTHSNYNDKQSKAADEGHNGLVSTAT